MREDAVFAARKKRVTEQLGEAVFAAVGLMVWQYLGAPTTDNGGQDSADAAWEDRTQTLDAPEAVNDSFDMTRYLRLRQEASAAEPERSGSRADAEKQEDAPSLTQRTGKKRASARTAEGDAEVRTAEKAERSAAAPENGAIRHAAAESTVWTGGGDASLLAARGVSGEIERDARRYDGGFYLY